MIKSKKLFARALYLVFALALVAGLSLVPAVAADTPADTDVGFQFGRGAAVTHDDSIATWSDAKAGDADAMGDYSVKLNVDDSEAASGDVYVEFIPAAGTTLSDLEALTNDWSFWYYLVGTPSPAGPQLELKFTSGTDFVDITIMAAQASYATENAWTEVVLSGGLTLVNWWGPVVDYGEGTLTQALTAVLGDEDVSGDWELTLVQAEMHETDPARDCHIDDITIDGTTYELEPIFLDAEYYSVGDTVDVTVPNFGANTDPIRVNPVTAEQLGVNADWWQVTATSDSDSEGITVDLEETGIDTGVFTGLFTTTDTLPAAEDELYVQDGDDIKMAYTGDWGAGEQILGAYTLASVDDTEPTITDLTPADDDMIEETMPEISATYSDDPDVSGIDEDSVEIIVDGVDVTDDATIIASSVTYTPEDDLAEGSHDVTVSVSDLAGNEATESWSFRVVSWLETDSVICGDALNELDALDTVGVAVSITGDTGAITVGRYASNPEPAADAPSNLIEDGFFDVQVTACTGTATQVVIKFADANITAESTAYVFDDLQGMWLACSDQGYNPTDEFLWVKVREADTTPNISELGGTPFAISGEAAVAKGDFDDDGDIDIVDFVQFATAYGSELGDDNYNAIGDFDDDGDIDILDFVQFATGYGTSW